MFSPSLDEVKEIAKNNQSNTTSFSNNSIQNLAQLSKANNHNLRKYDNKTEQISVIYGTNNLIKEFAKIDEGAAKLMIPYLIWLTFASYLNIAIALHR